MVKRYAATGNPNITVSQLNTMCQESLSFKQFPVIAANIDYSTVQVFDVEHTPDVEVAVAVVASMSTPGVFVPVSIEIDGVAKNFVGGG